MGSVVGSPITYGSLRKRIGQRVGDAGNRRGESKLADPGELHAQVVGRHQVGADDGHDAGVGSNMRTPSRGIGGYGQEYGGSVHVDRQADADEVDVHDAYVWIENPIQHYRGRKHSVGTRCRVILEY
jgi:hypothetical protein